VALHITASMVQTWLEPTKATISSVDTVLEGQIANEVLGRLAQTFTQPLVATWVDTTTTPAVVQQIIVMYYAGWFYDRASSTRLAQLTNTNCDDLSLGPAKFGMSKVF